jgi:isoquinoline 1-oxidoreductase beta subunit
VIVDSAVPIGYWRSVGHSHNAFFKESFLDELAHAAGQDGVRSGAAAEVHPRHLAVLDAALARAGAAPAGRAHGVAVHQSFGTIVAQVAEVSVEGGRSACTGSCARSIAASSSIRTSWPSRWSRASCSACRRRWAARSRIVDGRVRQSNFGDYPVLRMAQAPQVETIFVASAEPPEGMGEPAVPPVAPAVANAVFKLTGTAAAQPAAAPGLINRRC